MIIEKKVPMFYPVKFCIDALSQESEDPRKHARHLYCNGEYLFGMDGKHLHAAPVATYFQAGWYAVEKNHKTKVMLNKVDMGAHAYPDLSAIFNLFANQYIGVASVPYPETSCVCEAYLEACRRIEDLCFNFHFLEDFVLLSAEDDGDGGLMFGKNPYMAQRHRHAPGVVIYAEDKDSPVVCINRGNNFLAVFMPFLQ